MTDVVAAEMLRAVVTEKGMAAAVQAATLGKPVKIHRVGIGTRAGTPNDQLQALPGEVFKVPVADGRVVNSNQVNVSALIDDTKPSAQIYGIGFYLEDGTLFSVYQSTEMLLVHTEGSTLLIGMDFVMDNLPSDSVIVESTEANLMLGDWVPVYRKVNGKSLNVDIRLTAEDVGAAPAGFGLGGNGARVPNTDINQAVASGMYAIYANDTGSPDASGMGPSGSRLLVIAWGPTHVTQVFFRVNSNSVWVRHSQPHSSNESGRSWASWSQVYTTSFKPTAADVGAVPTARKVNNKPLTSDVTITLDELGGVPKTRKVNNKALSGDITLSAEDVGARPANWSPDLSGYVPKSRKVNGKALDADVTLTNTDVKALPDHGFGMGNKQSTALNAVDFTEDKTRDFNKLITAGEYTCDGSWVNCHNNTGAAATLVGLVKVEVRRFSTGPSVKQTYSWLTNGVIAGMVRGGTGSYPNITWSNWQPVGNWEHTAKYRICIDRDGETAYPYLTLYKRDDRTDIADNVYYVIGMHEFRHSTPSDPNNPASGLLAAHIYAETLGNRSANRVTMALRNKDNVTKSLLRLKETDIELNSNGKALTWDGDELKSAAGRFIREADLNGKHPAGATRLSSAADLNEIQTPGYYYQDSNANAGTGKNYPRQVAGSLVVKMAAGVVQEYHCYSSSEVYVRGYYNNKWSAWAKQYNTENKPTPTELAVMALKPSQGAMQQVDGQIVVQHDSGLRVNSTDGAYGLRMVYSGGRMHFQSGKVDQDESAQQLVMSGQYGKPLSFFRLMMKDGAFPYVYQNGQDYRLYGQHFKPTHTDVGAAPAGFGLGGNGVTPPENDLNMCNGSGFYLVSGSCTNTPFTTGPSGSNVLHQQWSGNHACQTFTTYNSDRVFMRRKVSNVWSDWFEMYSTSKKPTAADVGAVPTSRKVNNKPLTSDVTITLDELGGVPKTRKVNNKALSGDITLSAEDVGASPSNHNHNSQYYPLAGNAAVTGYFESKSYIYATAAMVVQDSAKKAWLGLETPGDAAPYISYKAPGMSAPAIGMRFHTDRVECTKSFDVQGNVTAAAGVYSGGGYITMTSTGNNTLDFHQKGNTAAMMYKPVGVSRLRFGQSNGAGGEVAGWAEVDGDKFTTLTGVQLQEAGVRVHSANYMTPIDAYYGNGSMVQGRHSEVGTYAFAALLANHYGGMNPGGQVSGAHLRVASCAEYGYNGGWSLPGTWMCCGHVVDQNDDRLDDRTTLWFRVA